MGINITGAHVNTPMGGMLYTVREASRIILHFLTIILNYSTVANELNNDIVWFCVARLYLCLLCRSVVVKYISPRERESCYQGGLANNML
jgi:hypothetical protein